jgi:hypothetical protein
MIEYQFESRDGNTYTFESDKELSSEDIAYINAEINPVQISDYFAGAVASVSRFGYNTLEFAHEVGNFIGDVLSKSIYGTTSRDIPNPWPEFRQKSDEYYVGDVPQYVKDGLAYKVVQSGSQLAPMIALAPLSAVTLTSQGFAAGRDDFIQSLGKPVEEMSNDELEAARAVGAMNAIPTLLLERVGLGRIVKGLKGNTSSSAFAEVGKMFTTEGGTEALETISSNLIASQVAGYDPDRAMTEGAGEAFLIGGIVGGGAGSVRYAPVLASESFQATYNVTGKSIDFIGSLKSTQSLLDISNKGFVNMNDFASDLGAKIVQKSVDNGVDFRPLVNGGVTVAKGIKDKIVQSDTLQNTLSFIDKVVRPLKSNVSSINERVGYVLYEFEYNTKKRAAENIKGFTPFFNAYDELTGKNQTDLHKSLLQGDFNKAQQIIESTGVENAWQSVGSTLKRIYDEAKVFGSEIGYIEEYFPRFVKDYKALAKDVGVEISDSQWQKALKDAEEVKGEPLTKLEEGALFEELITRKKFESVEAGKPSATKERKIDIVGDDLLKHYLMPNEALGLYANQMSDHIARLEYTGAVDGLVREQEESNIIPASESYKGKRIGTTFIPKDRLPKHLAGAKPKYRNSNIAFQSDVDKALYIAQASSGKRRQEYASFAAKALGITVDEAIQYGSTIKDSLRGLYGETPGGLLQVSKQFDTIRDIQGVPEDAETLTLEEMPKGSVSKRKVGIIGKVIAEEREAGRLNDMDTDKLYDLLGARFQRKTPMSGFIRGTKTLTHLAFLGSPTSTITQLGDYAYSFHKNGINESFRSLGKAIGGKDTWTLEDLNLANNEIAFEFGSDADAGSFKRIPKALQNTLDRVFTLTGFRKMDEKAKETFLTGTANKWKGILNGSNAPARRVLEQRFIRLQGQEQGRQTAEDIRAGRKTENVAEMLFYELGDIAPISQSDMPYFYNKIPNYRILYTLKSYTLKQFDFVRREAFSKMFSGDKEQVKEGYKNLMSLVISLGLANAPAEALKALITGDEIRLDDLTTENLWRLLGLNSYTGVIIQRDGVGSAIENLTYTLPIWNIIDDVSRDVFTFSPPLISDESKSVRYIPVVGNLIYKWEKNYGEEE